MKGKYTPFGQKTRALRFASGQVLADMAGDLGVSVSFLAAVEAGKYNVPEDWPQKLAELYALDGKEAIELETATGLSRTSYKLDTREVGDTKRELAYRLSREFEEMENSTAQELLELLKKEKS